ncbi:twin-arginine translocase TatA/TatE family subunit [Georgenia yuyongxinii]|uniref:Sec-independent protein translocase protein TatA n=1 Tax=Georgenia yuyongxinii TaxID=2589797 RepID=A0A5B8C6R9_9MICO|nr:twin-arginine translocase TatA/TatE family subunit [Georgenia yuyongxinii]
MFRNGLQPTHIIILLLVILLIFGASKLPDIAKSIGQSLKVFKKEVKELREDDDGASSYTATGGQPPQTAYPPYPGAQVPPAGVPQAGQPVGYPQAGQPVGYPQAEQPVGYPQPGQPAAYPQAAQPGVYPPPVQDPHTGQAPQQPGQNPPPQP